MAPVLSAVTTGTQAWVRTLGEFNLETLFEEAMTHRQVLDAIKTEVKAELNRCFSN